MSDVKEILENLIIIISASDETPWTQEILKLLEKALQLLAS